MSEPSDDSKCLACEHAFSLHDADAAERWKALTECECCLGGEFIGEPVAVDDMDEDQMEAWRAHLNERRNPPQEPTP